MMGAHAEVTINRSAAEVWSVIGDFGDVSWIPNVTSVNVDGDIRRFKLGDSEVRHRLVRRDDDERTYTYGLVSGSSGVVTDTEATISVQPDGPSAATVTWRSATQERRGSSEGLNAFFQRILNQLKSQLEHV